MSAELRDIAAHDYHDDRVADVPSLSNSVAKILIDKSPAHARAAHPKLNPELERKSKKEFDLGTAAHGLLLEDDESKIEVVNEANWLKKAAQQKRAEAYLAGRTPLLTHQWADVQKMVGAAREQLQWFRPVPFTDGQSEKTIVWEEDNGVVCRARLDWLRDDLLVIDDYKTTGASAAPEAWPGTMFGFGGDIQVAFYTRGIRALTLRQPIFRFIVQELAYPYAVGVFSLPPDVLAVADAKVDYAIAKWGQCLETGVWPAYPREVCYPLAKPWAEEQWLDRAARDMSTEWSAA